MTYVAWAPDRLEAVNKLSAFLRELAAPELARDEWAAAKRHFDEVRQQYQNLEGMPGTNTTIALRHVFDPLAKRYNNSERSQELLDAMRGVQ